MLCLEFGPSGTLRLTGLSCHRDTSVGVGHPNGTLRDTIQLACWGSERYGLIGGSVDALACHELRLVNRLGATSRHRARNQDFLAMGPIRSVMESPLKGRHHERQWSRHNHWHDAGNGTTRP